MSAVAYRPLTNPAPRKSPINRQPTADGRNTPVMAVRVGVLGPVGIGTGARIEPLAGLPGRLLAVLAADPNRLFDANVLMDALWGENLPQKARNTLQVTVNRLRRQLEPQHQTGTWSALVTEGSRYRLNLDNVGLDADDFRRRVADAREARRADNQRKARELLTESLTLWRGAAFDGHSDSDLIQAEAASLEELRLAVEEDLVDIRLDLGEHEDLTVELPGLVERSPLREHRWAQLMLALYLSGRQAEALRAFQRLQQTLGDELGIEPSLELIRLEERILLQDEALEPGRAVQVVDLPVVPTSFVGREQDLGQVAKLLTRARMVTLTGIGGIGKTRLALAVAAEVMTEFRDGVIFADLADLADSSHVVTHVIHAIDERARGHRSAPGQRPQRFGRAAPGPPDLARPRQRRARPTGSAQIDHGGAASLSGRPNPGDEPDPDRGDRRVSVSHSGFANSPGGRD